MADIRSQLAAVPALTPLPPPWARTFPDEFRTAASGVDRYLHRTGMDALAQDLRRAARQIIRAPSFSFLTIGTLALGIGAAAALFGVVDRVLLRPLPYGEPDRIVALRNQIGDQPDMPLSGPEYLDYREGLRTLDDLAAYRRTELNLFGDVDPERVPAALVTPNLVSVLGVTPSMGRFFLEAEAAPGAPPPIVLSGELWRRRFGADPSVVGRTVEVDGAPATIVGVMPVGFGLPEDFAGERRAELWIPLGLTPADAGTRGLRNLRAIGRLAPGASVEGANRELGALVGAWSEVGLVTTTAEFSAPLLPAREVVAGGARTPLLMLFGAVGLVLLVAAANVANLLLVRLEGRRREIAVRAALGADRAGVLRHLMAESLVLTGAGGMVGLLLASVGLWALRLLGPVGIPRLDQVALDARAIGFALAVVLLVTIFLGILSAARAFPRDPGARLREGGRGASGGRETQRLRQALTIAQVALSMILLTGAALLGRSQLELNRIDLGFTPDDVLTMQVTLPGSAYASSADLIRFYEEAVRGMAEIPGVLFAGATAGLPLAEPAGDWGIDIEGRERGPTERFLGFLHIVTPGYLETMRFARVAGRLPDPRDGPEAAPIVVVNRTMAGMYWPAGEAVGSRIRIRGVEGEWFTVAGVIGDSRHDEVLAERRPEMYFLHAQLPMALGGTVAAMTIAIRTAGPPMEVAAAAREVIRGIDPRLPVGSVRTMDEVVAEALAEPRFTTSLLTLFAILAMLLGLIGIYGIVSFGISQRVRELGIRVALGADEVSILQVTMRQGVTIVASGLAIGIVGALVATRYLRGLLYGVAPTDPATFVTVAVLLGAAALGASLVPARRAARVDPVVALRSD
jgi:putative ABC transport system permease protein